MRSPFAGCWSASIDAESWDYRPWIVGRGLVRTHTPFDRKLADGVELFLVARVDGEIVGSAMGGYEGHRAWVNYLAVVPERQGEGIARAIMRELELRCREIGCPKINLQIRTTNTQVIDFYRKIGFSVDDVMCMGKRLIDDAAR